MTALLFYVGLGAILTLEEAGVFFLPGDISLVAAGLHSSQGESNAFFSWAVASTGMVLGASVLYHGLSQSGTVKRVLPQRVVSLMHRHPIEGVAVARLVPGLRNATVFAAASSRLPYRTFLLGLLPAAMLWSGLLLTLGWFGGGTMLVMFGHLHHSRILKAVSIALLLAAGIFFWIRLRGAEVPEVVSELATRGNDIISR